MKNKCQQCGLVNYSQDMYCRRCNTYLMPSLPPARVANPEIPRRRSFNGGWLLLCFAFMGGGSYFAYQAYHKPPQTDDPAEQQQIKKTMQRIREGNELVRDPNSLHFADPDGYSEEELRQQVLDQQKRLSDRVKPLDKSKLEPVDTSKIVVPLSTPAQ